MQEREDKKGWIRRKGKNCRQLGSQAVAVAVAVAVTECVVVTQFSGGGGLQFFDGKPEVNPPTQSQSPEEF